MGILRKLLADKRGVATIEYGLLAGLIALGVVTSIGKIGSSLAAALDDVHSQWTNASGGPAPDPGGAGKPGKGKPGKGKGKGTP